MLCQEPSSKGRAAQRRSSPGRRPPCRLAGFALVFQPEALAGDLHDVGMVQQAVEHRCRQRLVVGKGAGPLRERQVAREHHRAAFVAFGHDVEEQVGLVSPEGQVADLVDHQQLRAEHSSVGVFL